MILEKINNLSIYFCENTSDMNAELFVRKFFEKKGYNVIKKNGIPLGIPDFLCEKKKEKFYVEVKNKKDSLRISQMRWIKENFDKPTIIFVTDREISEKLNQSQSTVSISLKKLYEQRCIARTEQKNSKIGYIYFIR